MLFDPVRDRFDSDSTSAAPSEGYITERLEFLAPLKHYHYDDLRVGMDFEGKMFRAEFIIHDKLTTEFKTFIGDLLRVKNVFMPFADGLCNHNNYPSTEKVIEVFQKFSATHNISNSYLNLESSGSMCMGHTVIETKKGPILCETYRFHIAGSLSVF